MEHKFFLGRYRVAADEIALAAPEATAGTAVVVTEQHAIATIYRGVDVEANRDVSIEVIPATGLKPVVREELEAEAIAAKKINHINIPALYDFGIEDDQLIYVTEYFDGTTAEEWVNTHGPMPTGAVLRIALQVVAAMGASAFHKISHHAINPLNVMLVPGQTPEGDWPLIKVLHFVGVAPTFSSADISVASFDKTTHYASPEQLRDGKVDFRSEIYSLGATMWFLLTGAPPLMAPKGPLAMQPTTIGLSVDNLSGMPKRVRRLLAQMLSVDPDARPQDALAFYRQIQECLAQVGRRESMARRFGLPFASESKAITFSKPRRFPAKALALAALLIALVSATAVILPRYLHHQRVRNAEEPIGVPIGVPDATAPAPQAPAPAPAQAPTTVAATNPADTAPAPTIKPLPADSETATAQTNAAPVNPPPAQAKESEPVVAANQQPVPPPPSSTVTQPQETAPPANVREPEQPMVAANETRRVEQKPEVPQPKETAPPANISEPEQPKVAANETRRVEQHPEVTQPKETAPPANLHEPEQPKVAANETRAVEQPETTTTRSKSQEPARTETEKPTTSHTTEVAAIPTARPVTPEVRRAEPAPPSEGPEEVTAPAPATEKKIVTTTSKPKKERAKKPKREVEQEEVIAQNETPEEQQVEETTMPQLPRGRTRARFIGVTADGNWMFSLPSKKVVIVPPPPGG